MAKEVASVKGGLFEQFAGGKLVLPSGLNPIRKQVARRLDENGVRPLQEIGRTLTEGGAGDTALKTHAQIGSGEGDGSDLSGKRTIETVTDVNRVTTSDDETEVSETIWQLNTSPVYPRNGDRSPLGMPGQEAGQP